MYLDHILLRCVCYGQPRTKSSEGAYPQFPRRSDIVNFTLAVSYEEEES